MINDVYINVHLSPTLDPNIKKAEVILEGYRLSDLAEVKHSLYGTKCEVEPAEKGKIKAVVLLYERSVAEKQFYLICDLAHYAYDLMRKRQSLPK